MTTGPHWVNLEMCTMTENGSNSNGNVRPLPPRPPELELHDRVSAPLLSIFFAHAAGARIFAGLYVWRMAIKMTDEN